MSQNDNQQRSAEQRTVTDRTPREPKLNLNFPPGAQPDIIRANQKDVYYLSVLQEQMSSVCQQLFGSRRQHQWQKAIATFSDFCYYGLTTLLGTQTLGEEYCDIVQISEKSQTYPGFLRRASLVFIHTLLPYIYARGSAELKKRARQHSLRHPRQPDDKEEMLLQKIQSWLPAIHEFIVKNVRPIHLAIFYFFGAYYSFSKRITGIRYIFTRQLGPHEERVGYEVLGVLICIQLAIQAFRAAHRYIENVRAASQAVKVQGEEEAKENAAKEQDDEYGFMDELLEKKAEDAEEEELTINEEDLTYEELQMLKCALCLEPRKRTTATQCGHLFCWDCIIEWCQNKPECPLCRSSVNISHLLPLNNF